MYLARRVALNGIYLDDVDSRVVISSVETADGKENITAVDNGARYGQRITGDRRSTLDVVIKFRIRNYGKSTLGMQARAELLEKINVWAYVGGYLTVNYKPDRRIYVKLAQAPGEGSLWDFSKEFQMTFRAYGVPYWEQETTRALVLGTAATSGSGTAVIEGSVKTQVNATLRNMSGMTINTATITIGGKSMSFTGLGLNASESLVIDHSVEGLLRIRILGSGNVYRSAMSARSSASANDFLIAPGSAECVFASQRACSMTVQWRARYI